DEPGQRFCELCCLWFCRSHFPDPEWHPCAPEQGDSRAAAVGSPARPLAIAQQQPREFLTDARASASVNICGLTPFSACAPCANFPGERTPCPTRSSRSRLTTAPTTIWSEH